MLPWGYTKAPPRHVTGRGLAAREGATVPTYIVKPNRDEDFYVWWSTIVDCPVGWGPRDDSEPAVRYERADKEGSSVQWRAPGYPVPFGWDDESFTLMEQDDLDYTDAWWDLPRANLREFCRCRDEGRPIDDLVRRMAHDDED